MAQGDRETEIKLPVRDAESARRLLREHGFEVLRPRVFESNVAYDTPAGALRQEACLLRLRQAGDLATLTYKGRPEISTHKSREELETRVTDAPTLGRILERLGFHPSMRYEKYRTEFHQPRGHDIATIDETPIGVFVELEGSPEWIDRTARELGFTPADYITASYYRLYVEWCQKRGVEPADMTFAGKR